MTCIEKLYWKRFIPCCPSSLVQQSKNYESIKQFWCSKFPLQLQN